MKLTEAANKKTDLPIKSEQNPIKKQDLSFQHIIKHNPVKYHKKILIPFLENLLETRKKSYLKDLLKNSNKKANLQKALDITEEVKQKTHKQNLLNSLLKVAAISKLKDIFREYLKKNPSDFEKEKEKFLKPQNLTKIMEKIIQMRNPKSKGFLALKDESVNFEIITVKIVKVNLKTVNVVTKNNVGKAIRYMDKNQIATFNQYDEFNYKGFSKDK